MLRYCMRILSRYTFILLIICGLYISLCLLNFKATISFSNHIDGVNELSVVREIEWNFSQYIDNKHCNVSCIPPLYTRYTATQCNNQNNTRPKNKLPSSEEYFCDIQSYCMWEEKNKTRGLEGDLCPCWPQELRGSSFPDLDALLSLQWSDLKRFGASVSPGGYWRPSHCTPRRKVAVLVPYRDREHHLKAFLAHYHPLFQRQLLEYRVFVIEQDLPYIFNKAAILNAGFIESQKVFDADCILMIDVDTLAERDDNMIVCEEQPVHWGVFVNRTDYRLRLTNFGAAVILSKSHYELVNGFSNLFWGWGGEDDDIRDRINARKMDIYHSPNEIGRFVIMSHKRDTTYGLNYKRDHILRHARRHTDEYWTEGLNSADYEVVDWSDKSLYTWILVKLNEVEPEEAYQNSHQDRKGKFHSNLFSDHGEMLDLLREYRHDGLGRLDMIEALKSIFSMKYRKKEPQIVPSEYVSFDGSCGTGPFPEATFYKSKTSCKYLCDMPGEVQSCTGFEYHEPLDGESYCILLSSPCNISTNGAEGRMYIKKEHSEEFVNIPPLDLTETTQP